MHDKAGHTDVIRACSIRNCHVGCISQYSNTAPRLRDKLLYLVLFSLYLSLFLELKTRNLKIYNFDLKSSAPFQNIDISNVKVGFKRWYFKNSRQFRLKPEVNYFKSTHETERSPNKMNVKALLVFVLVLIVVSFATEGEANSELRKRKKIKANESIK